MQCMEEPKQVRSVPPVWQPFSAIFYFVSTGSRRHWAVQTSGIRVKYLSTVVFCSASKIPVSVNATVSLYVLCPKCPTHHLLSHYTYFSNLLGMSVIFCCTRWERSPDWNVLDIEFMTVNPAATIFLFKNIYDQYPYAAMNLYNIVIVCLGHTFDWHEAMHLNTVLPHSSYVCIVHTP